MDRKPQRPHPSSKRVKLTADYRHVCTCGEEWTDKYPLATCPNCGKRDVESPDTGKESR